MEMPSTTTNTNIHCTETFGVEEVNSDWPVAGTMTVPPVAKSESKL